MVAVVFGVLHAGCERLDTMPVCWEWVTRLLKRVNPPALPGVPIAPIPRSFRMEARPSDKLNVLVELVVKYNPGLKLQKDQL